MDVSRSSLCQQDASELFGMLESSDPQTVESVKVLIQENLTGTKDVWLTHGLLDYYIAVQSTRALDILVRVREPHDKHIFDRMTDYLKSENTRYQCLLLLSHLIHRQPSWLFKITQHRVFQVLLNLLKNEVDPPCLMCALFSIVSLLPMVPYQIGSYLNDIFEVFSRLAAWSSKRSIGIPEVYVLHLQVGVYALFHRLYGMYPCNFLGYLRSYYGGREFKEENIRIFATTIRPMLEKVRLHPLLVTACKDSEISQKRWKRMAAHDIVALCASVSLDAAEGTPEDTRCRSALSPIFSGQLATQSQESSMQFLSFSSMSSTVSVNIESNSLVNDAVNNKTEGNWTPGVCALSTPPPVTPFQNVFENCNQDAQDLENQLRMADSSINQTEAMVVTDQENIEIGSEITNEGKMELFVVEALEAKEEELVDKEVSELTSNPLASDDSVKTRHDTPFRSTTQNLTDKAEFDVSNSDSMVESKDDVGEDSDFGVQEHNELKMETIVRTMNRLRYFSQCGQPPEVSNECSKQPVTRRSLSCPNINLGAISVSSSTNFSLSQTIPENSMCDEKPRVSPAQVASPGLYNQNTIWNDSVPGQSLHLPETSYDHLIPLALEPLGVSGKVLANDESIHSATYKSPEYTPFYCSLSPAELLDRHLQFGSDAHLIQLCSIPLTSTKNADWTHFGGKPPADEIALSRTQVQLLHNQVMFERHRREIHAERNRRLLGKAKRSQIQEENTATLKDQVFLLSKENEDLKKELKVQTDLYQQLENMKKQAEKEFSITLGRLTQESTNLQYSNKKLQGLLVSQKQENDMLKEENKLIQSQIVDMKFEHEFLLNELDHAQKMENELLWFSKENILLQEMNRQIMENYDLEQQRESSDIALELLQEAACAEVKNLKEKLDSKSVLIDALKGKVSTLEEELSVAKLRLTERSQVEEQIRALHRDEIRAREERLNEHRRIHALHMAQILDLYREQEALNEEIEFLKKKLQNSAKDGKNEVQPVSSEVPENNCTSEDTNGVSVTSADKTVFSVSNADNAD